MLSKVKIIDIPEITAPDGSGTLAVVEKDCIPFQIKRVYYLYNVPASATRGGHAHKKLLQCLVALNGSFTIKLNDGNSETSYTLDSPNKALFIPNKIWRDMENFSKGAICLSLVSEEYDEADYIRNYKDFLKFKKD